jgi:hypothetical protein
MPQVAGHRINPLEAPRDLAAARAQTVWVSPQTPSTIPRTRWRSRRLHISQADYSCRKRQSRAGTPAMSRSRKGILNTAGRCRDSAPSHGSQSPSSPDQARHQNLTGILPLSVTGRTTSGTRLTSRSLFPVAPDRHSISTQRAFSRPRAARTPLHAWRTDWLHAIRDSDN